MWIVKFGAKEVQKSSRDAGKQYMQTLVMEVNQWEVLAGQPKTTVDFQDTERQTIILLNGVHSGSIYEIRN